MTAYIFLYSGVKRALHQIMDGEVAMGKDLRCRLGRHAYQWDYLAENSCEQIKKCSRCDYKSTNLADRKTVPHQFSAAPRFIEEGRCEREQVCQRCQVTQPFDTHHDFSPWNYVSDDNCDQQRVCSRCKQIEYLCEQHRWGEAYYVRSSDCESEQECDHCHQKRNIGKRHQYPDEWTMLPDRCDERRICQNCGQLEQRNVEHRFSTWDYECPTSCRQERKCTHCEKKELQAEDEIVHLNFNWVRTKTSPVCTEERMCSRCGRNESREGGHTLDWVYEKDGACTQWVACTTCKNLAFSLKINRDELIPFGYRITQTHHEMTDRWEYKSDFLPGYSRKCEQELLCSRCGHRSGQTRELHEMSEWTPKAGKECTLIKTCKRCGYEKTGAIKHIWSDEWKYVQPGKCVQSQICIHCGEFKPKSEWKTRHRFADKENLSIQGMPVYDWLAAPFQIQRCQQCSEVNYGTSPGYVTGTIAGVPSSGRIPIRLANGNTLLCRLGYNVMDRFPAAPLGQPVVVEVEPKDLEKGGRLVTDHPLHKNLGLVVTLLQMKNIKGEPVYAYVQLPREKLEQIRQSAHLDEQFKVGLHGLILATGSGYPSPTLVQEMKSKYNVV